MQHDAGALAPCRAASSRPGAYYARHPAMYRLSMAATTGTAGYAVLRAVHARGGRRMPWIALACLQAVIAAGTVRVRLAATRCGGPARRRPNTRT